MSKQRAHRKSNGTPFFFRYFLSIVLRVFLSTRFSRPNTKQGYPHTKHMSFWKVLPQRISLETSLLWDLSHTFEMTSNVILTTAREEESLHIVTEQRFLVGLPASLGMTNKLHEIPPISIRNDREWDSSHTLETTIDCHTEHQQNIFHLSKKWREGRSLGIDLLSSIRFCSFKQTSRKPHSQNH